ncbi:MAG: hypothetical protein QF639_08700 [Rhodospirillales bacterium]|nr:hypothetical protein [Rhodospirillales bacterium]
MDFIYDSLARRIVFGPGRLRDLDAEIDAIGVLLVSSRRQRPALEPLVADLGGRAAGVFDDTFEHVRVETQHAVVVAANTGIGSMMIVASSNFDVPLVLAGLVILAVMGVALYAVFAILEQRMTFWVQTRPDEVQ